MTGQPPSDPRPKYRKPDTAPDVASIADRERWDQLVATSLANTQAAAEKWRTGLAAFVTIITAGLLVKGPEAARDLPSCWLLALTLLASLGLLCTIIGLWLALSAAAGTPARLNFHRIVDTYGGVRQFEVASAEAASNALRWARVVVGLALLLLGAAVVVWWWAPVAPTSVVKVTSGDMTICGELKSADDQELVIQVGGESDRTTIPFADVSNLRIVTEC
jgi:hypothetical protein